MAREMKDSGIEWVGKIPNDWQILFAFQIFEQVKNKNIGLLETNLMSLSYGKIVRKRIDTTQGLLPESFEGYNIIQKNDIVLRLTDLQNDHKSLRVGIAKEKGIITSAYLTLRSQNNAFPNYLYYYLHSFDISKGFYGMGAGVRQGLNWNELKHLLILFPSYKTQKAIADFLDSKTAEIDSIIEQTRSSIEEYKKLKQSAITEAVTKGIRPNRNMKDSGIEWIGEIPEDWEVIKHKYVMHKEKEICEHYNGEDIISLTMKGVIIRDLDGGGKMPTTFDGYQYVYPEELLLCLFDIDVTPRCVGVVRNYGLTSPAYSKFVLHDGYITSYYDYLLRAIDDSKVFVHLAKNLRSSLTENDFGSLPTIAPPYKEQIEIVSFLNRKIPEIDSLISKKEQLITELETYKKSLVYEYVTGKKEVKDSISVEYSPEFKKALLMCRILELTQCKGRIHLQKTFFALDTLLNLFSTQYYRFEHGPYDLNIERYEKIIEEKGWLNIYGGKATRYNKTSTFSDYYSEYEKVFKDKDGIIQRICKVFNVPRTTKAEKIATLLAVWNDFLVNGIEPTDDMIIDDVMTNWTPNKANTARETWSEFLSKIRENNIVPKGYGKHTKRMEEMNT